MAPRHTNSVRGALTSAPLASSLVAVTQNTKKEKLFIHIGLPKTGTTSIQCFLRDNREALGRHDIAHPHEFGAAHMHHFQVYATLPEPFNRSRAALGPELDDPQDFKRRLEEAVKRTVDGSSANRFLLSSEILSFLKRPAIQRLHELFAPHFEQFEIVVYLRRQDRQALSAYLQSFKGGYEYRPDFAGPFVRRRLSNRDMIENWAYEFGPQAVHPRLYERNRFPEGDVVRDFMLALGINRLDEFSLPLQRKNTTFGIKQIALARLLNPHFNRLSSDLSEKQELHDPEVMAFLRSLSNEPAYKPARNAALEYSRLHAEDNEWVRQNYFPAQTTLFSENFDDYPEEGVSERLSYEELCSALVELFRFHLATKQTTQASPAHVFEALGELAEALPIAPGTKRALRQRVRQAKRVIRRAGQLLKVTSNRGRSEARRSPSEYNTST